MPACLIEHEHHVFVGFDRLRELVEVDLHRGRRDLGQDQREGIVRTRLDSTVDVGERIALIALSGRALAARVPAMTDAALLPDACFILEKRADLLAWMCITNRFQPVAELF